MTTMKQDDVAAAVHGDELLLAMLRVETESEATWRAKNVSMDTTVKVKRLNAGSDFLFKVLSSKMDLVKIRLIR